MLSIAGHAKPTCDGFTRRDAIRIGAMGMGGLALPQLLAAEEQAGIRNSNKAVIMVYMCGAPPHQDGVSVSSRRGATDPGPAD